MYPPRKIKAKVNTHKHSVQLYIFTLLYKGRKSCRASRDGEGWDVQRDSMMAELHLLQHEHMRQASQTENNPSY